ncbi:MAG TPA: hypothetical protein VN989_11800, partial [Casimicrobiaceae bacterium]|nr:hypothetical protein [Casimicrobiaceae bacterium]
MAKANVGIEVLEHIDVGLPGVGEDGMPGSPEPYATAMGVRTRGNDLAAYLRDHAADQAARDDAARVIERWNRALATGRDMWWSPTIRAALVAGTPWLEVYCPGCQTIRALDIR